MYTVLSRHNEEVLNEEEFERKFDAKRYIAQKAYEHNRSYMGMHNYFEIGIPSGKLTFEIVETGKDH